MSVIGNFESGAAIEYQRACSRTNQGQASTVRSRHSGLFRLPAKDSGNAVTRRGFGDARRATLASRDEALIRLECLTCDAESSSRTIHCVCPV